MCMGKILSLKHQTASGNDNWKENPPKYHFSQRTILSFAWFMTETDINGIVAQVDVDVYTGFLFHGKPRRPAKTETPNIIHLQKQ